jgi:glycosyl transferase family 2
MTPLRWLGLLLGAALLTIALDRRRRWNRGDVVLLGALAVAIMVASATGWSAIVLEQFGFHRGHERQILGVVVFASAVLLLLIALALSRISAVGRNLDSVVEGVAYDQALREGELDRFEDRIAIVIPAYNEADNLGPVLDSIPPRLCGRETAVLVIDDGSRDRSLAVAREHGAAAARHVINRGQGAAMRTGYRIIADTRAAVVVAMDSDGQHQASEMERLVAPVLDGTVDLTNGSRTLPDGSGVRVHPMRDVGIVFFNRLISLLTRTRVTDCSNGYRAMRPQILHQIVLRQNQFHNSEFLIEAIKRGVPTREVPVTVVHRISGRSKKPAVLRYGLGFTRAIFRTWMR